MAPGSAMFIDNSIRTRVKESYVRTFNNTHRQGVLELDRKFCKEFNWKKNISLVPSFGGCLFLFHLHFWRFYSGESLGVYPLHETLTQTCAGPWDWWAMVIAPNKDKMFARLIAIMGNSPWNFVHIVNRKLCIIFKGCKLWMKRCSGGVCEGKRSLDDG